MKEQIKEEWKPVVGFESFYEVSNTGLVRSLNYKQTKKVKILSQSTSNGYKKVILSKNGKVKTIRVHRLVAMAFLPNTNSLPQINHKDENPSNNFVGNLEWCTNLYNARYGNRNKKISEKLSKCVYQYDLNFNLIKKWKSAYETRNHGFSPSCVCQCCRMKSTTHNGYMWSLKKLNTKTKKELSIKLFNIASNAHLHKKVYQYTKNKKLVKKWNSLSECKKWGFNISCISCCCKGVYKFHKGFVWSYNKL